MQDRFVLVILIVLISFHASSFAQKETTSSKILFHVTFDQIHFIGGEKGGITGAMAMEYYNNYLYIASQDQILQVNLKGEIIDIIGNSAASKIFPTWISDLIFIHDKLYVWLPPQRLLVIANKNIGEKLFIDFYSRNIEEITKIKNQDFYFQPRFLISNNTAPYFYDGNQCFSLESLTSIPSNGVSTIKDIDSFKINSENNRPVVGIPVSDCEYVESLMVKSRQLQKHINLNIRNYCKTSKGPVSNLVPVLHDNEIFVIKSIYKNSYLNNYFIFGAITDPDNMAKSIVFSIILLDQEFEIRRIVTGLQYHFGSYSIDPPYEASFTCDESGNIYYCTNRYDWDDISNSVVEVYKVEGIK